MTGNAGQRRIGLEALRQVDAIAPGQHHVHQHQVGLDGADALERRHAVGFEDEIDAVRFQRDGDELMREGVVLDDEDDRPGARGGPRPLGQRDAAGHSHAGGQALGVDRLGEVLDVVVANALAAQARRGGGFGGIRQQQHESRAVRRRP